MKQFLLFVLLLLACEYATLHIITIVKFVRYGLTSISYMIISLLVPALILIFFVMSTKKLFDEDDIPVGLFRVHASARVLLKLLEMAPLFIDDMAHDLRKNAQRKASRSVIKAARNSVEKASSEAYIFV